MTTTDETATRPAADDAEFDAFDDERLDDGAEPPSLGGRIATRVFRRPVAWYRRPWDDARMIRLSVTVATLVITTYVMLKINHAIPFVDDALFLDTTPRGGDLGAHVWGPAYLRDNLVSNFRLSGWSMDWYGGLPVYRFYMVIPALMILLLDVVLPYGVAMKLVVAAGLIAMPAASWAFGRLARFRYPMPELFAFGGLCFVLNESYSIMGGNVLSTMAGEFSFALAMPLMLVGFGLLCRALDDGRLPVLAALFLAMAGLAHGIVLIYTVIGALVIVGCKCGKDLWRVFVDVVNDARSSALARGLVYGLLMAPAAIAIGVLVAVWSGGSPLLPIGIAAVAVVAAGALVVVVGPGQASNRVFYRRFGYACLIGGLMVALSAFWVGPFLFNHAFMTDMKYGFEPRGGSFSSWWEMYFNDVQQLDIIVNSLAVFGFVASIYRRHVYGIALGVLTLVAAALVYVAKDSLPVIGLLWNPRVLPLLYLCRYLMMMVGAVELGTVVVNAVRRRRVDRPLGAGPASALTFVTGIVVLACLAFAYQVLPFATTRTETVVAAGAQEPTTQRFYQFGPISDPVEGRSKGDGWAAYNYKGYEDGGAWGEYRQLTMDMWDIGRERGCGRALWEIDNGDKDADGNELRPGNGRYGTTMALMLLPFWTEGCIASSEGLFFEASGTTPYHFLTADAVSTKASNPVRQLRWDLNDLPTNEPVEMLRTMGIDYYLATTEQQKAKASTWDGLEFIEASGPWDIYAVTDAALVEPLAVQPVVVNGRTGDQRECWLEVGTSWFQHQNDWPAIPVADGPADWQRIDVAIDETQQVPPGQGTDGCGDTSYGDAGRGRKVNIVNPATPVDVVELPEVEVSNVVMGEESVSFDVDQVGVPVIVRVSYFPNWTVSGAEGPYRVAPNFMVVVPTENHVELRYESYSNTDLFFYGLTFVGIVGAAVVRRRGPFSFGEAPPTPEGHDADPTALGLPAGDATIAYWHGDDERPATGEGAFRPPAELAATGLWPDDRPAVDAEAESTAGETADAEPSETEAAEPATVDPVADSRSGVAAIVEASGEDDAGDWEGVWTAELDEPTNSPTGDTEVSGAEPDRPADGS